MKHFRKKTHTMQQTKTMYTTEKILHLESAQDTDLNFKTINAEAKTIIKIQLSITINWKAKHLVKDDNTSYFSINPDFLNLIN